MRKTLSMYIMTFLIVGCMFKSGPDFESMAYPVVINQSISDVRREDAMPVIKDQSITDIYRTNDRVCYTWKFTKARDIPLSFIGFNVIDAEGNHYDAETSDQDTGLPIYSHPTNRRFAVGQEAIRHLCTTLPDKDDPLTVRGILVYKTWINLWNVTHYTHLLSWFPKGDK